MGRTGLARCLRGGMGAIFFFQARNSHQAWLTLKSLTSLNEESRPFFLGDTSIWSFRSVSLVITAFGGPESYFSLAIIAFGAFEFVVSKYDGRLGKMEFKESSLLNLRRLGSSSDLHSKQHVGEHPLVCPETLKALTGWIQRTVLTSYHNGNSLCHMCRSTHLAALFFLVT